MPQQHVNIGSFPSDGSGDPIRVAYDKINQNFTELYTGVTILAGNIGLLPNLALDGTGPVVSVAGRTGNVLLSIDDIYGGVSRGYVTNQIDLAITQSLTSLVDAAPDALNTLRELAAAVADGSIVATEIMTELGTKLPKSGGIMTGPLILQANPSVNLGAATKQYVDMFVNSLGTTISSLSTLVDEKESIANVAAMITTVNSDILTLTANVAVELDTKANIADVYTKNEIDQLLLNITIDGTFRDNWGLISDINDWGIVTEPATFTEDYGSIQ